MRHEVSFTLFKYPVCIPYYGQMHLGGYFGEPSRGQGTVSKTENSSCSDLPESKIGLLQAMFGI